jgi:hypothetical protein
LPYRQCRALLLARVYEVFPLVCPRCGGAMHIIAFITDGPTVRDILGHLGEPTRHPASPPPAARRCGRPPTPNTIRPLMLLQCAPAFEFDQPIAW